MKQDHEQFDKELYVKASSAMLDVLAATSAMTDGRRVLGEILCGALDTMGTNAPMDSVLGGLKDDAEWWADTATPHEVEAYTAAGLRRIERGTFAPAARKRIFLAIWQAMSDEDKFKFLGKVDPGGKFVGGK